MKKAILILALVASHSRLCRAQEDVDWVAYGGESGGMRFARGNQITTANVAGLKVAWTCQTGELEIYRDNDAEEKAAFEATALMVDGVIYISTPSDRVLAIDAVSGNKIWTYDPHVDLSDDFSEITSRGVSTWPGHDTPDPAAERRILVATIDGRLIALHAADGKPVESFGNHGTVDLKSGIGNISVTSPPAVIGETIVVGSSMGDNTKLEFEHGTVQAFDVISGKLKWQWDPIPRKKSDPAYATWKGKKASKTGAANAWSIISSDPSRDLVFVPTTCPSPDYYGGERKGQNLYANSIVALNASTGRVVWHFQVVHHDIWDYDIAAQPLLFDFMRNGEKVAAVAVGTKMGHVFVLNRETGDPLFPVEERPVPSSNIPGEEAYSTQPFPVLPKPLGLQHIGIDDAWGTTPEEVEAAQNRMSKLRYDGTFTPASFEGTLVVPSNVGGIHWGGMSYDPERQLLVTNINRLAAIITLIPRDRYEEVVKNRNMVRAETGWQYGTPYVLKRDYLMVPDEQGFRMQSRPPWGTLLAIDMTTGALKWETPLGFMMDPAKYPEAVHWGSLNLGGALTTAGGLTFVAATVDGFLRAFDTESGKLLWQDQLPVPAMATPMSYVLHGRQYIVIAAGGHGKVHTKLGDYLIAYSLEP